MKKKKNKETLIREYKASIEMLRSHRNFSNKEDVDRMIRRLENKIKKLEPKESK